MRHDCRRARDASHVTARRTRSMTKPVSRAYLRHVRRTLLAIKAGRQGGRRETRSSRGRTGHRRAARATWTQAEEDAPGICVLRRPLRASCHGRMRHSADLAISGTPSMVVRLCSYAARTAERVVLVAVPRGRVGRADRRRLGIRTHDPGRFTIGHEKRRRAIIAS
jgi:hypothetical protein